MLLITWRGKQHSSWTGAALLLANLAVVVCAFTQTTTGVKMMNWSPGTALFSSSF